MSTSDKTPAGGTGTPVVDPRKQSGAERPRLNRGLVIGGIVLAVIAAAALAYGLAAQPAARGAAPQVRTAPVRRGDLTVSVTEGGALTAMESLEIKSEVEGRRTIIEIVDEGTAITAEDVENGKVLVRLDSSDLEETRSSKEISFYRAEASYKQAEESLAIQKKQNESNVAIAELNVKFARMELERYLGAELAGQVIDAAAGFAELGANPLLGGTAQQTLRDLEAQVQLANEELTRAEETLEWTSKLLDRGYVNRNELTADQLAVTRRRIELESAREELRLFERYTLPKEAEQRYSDYVEYLRDLDRVMARARSQLAQAEAGLKSRKASYKLEKERFEKFREMVEKCVIRAPKPGRVVYASTSDPRRRRRDPIREGGEVRQNESILVIPELSTLAAQVNLHETDIQKVQRGQKAIVTVEAIPGRTFPGKVVRTSPVASSAHAWLNPEIKVYETDVALEEVDGGLTPGMTATAEIIIADLKDVLYVPLEAVTSYGGQHVCLVEGPRGPQVRPVKTGHFTGELVEIRDGLELGELVRLAPGEFLGEETWEAAPAPEEVLEHVAEKLEEAAPPQEAPQEPAPAEGPGPPGAMPPLDWATVGPKLRELRDLPEQERAARVEELLRELPEDQRDALRQMLQRFQGGPPPPAERRQQGGARQGEGPRQ